MLRQVPADRLGPGVEPGAGELAAQPHDELHHRVGSLRR